MMNKNKISRRNFIKNSSVTAIGAGIATNLSIASNIEDENINNQKIKEYRVFGRTGFKVSDISSGNPSNENILRELLKNGVNLIDTGETYANGNSEILIGKVLKDFNRSKIFINSKLYTEKEFPSKKDVLERTYKCLERLETDYVDCMQIHSAENSAILKDEAFHGAMEQLKKEGKVRYIGVSCHGSNWAYNTEESMDKILLSAIDDGRFDVFLMAYNFVNADIAEKVLEECDKHNIATIIMKSNPVYIYGLLENRINNLLEKGEEADEYTRDFYDKYKMMQENALIYFGEYGITGEKEIMEAASKFVLSNQKAHTTAWDFRNFDDLELMLNLSGKKLTIKDEQVLEGYHKYFGKFSCRIGCNDCQSACPEHLPVNKILRYNYYYTAKRQEKRAITKFNKLKSNKPSDVCTNCEGYCEKACKYEVFTRPLLAMAQNNMEFKV